MFKPAQLKSVVLIHTLNPKSSQKNDNEDTGRPVIFNKAYGPNGLFGSLILECLVGTKEIPMKSATFMISTPSVGYYRAGK